MACGALGELGMLVAAAAAAAAAGRILGCGGEDGRFLLVDCEVTESRVSN